MRVLDLFSGIGGFSLGLERAGMRTVAFCEIDPYCRRVLAKHWPGVPIFGDIAQLGAEEILADTAWNVRSEQEESGTERERESGQPIDLICGGFPCQDISVAGKGAGLAGARSGLWSEFARLIRELRPQYAIVENVAALLGRGLGAVLGDLAALGYDAEWHCIPASAVGAPHRRDRVWIVAYPSERGHRSLFQPEREQRSGAAPDTGSDGETWAVADSDELGLQGRLSAELPQRPHQWSVGPSGASANPDSQSTERPTEPWRQRGQWESEPDVGRVANGVPSRVDRLRALGNAVVPQVVEVIGRAIMQAHNGSEP